MGRGHGEKLSRTRELAVASLLAARTIGEAANACGVSEKSLKNWLKEPAFRAAFRDARQQVLDRTVSRLVTASARAVETLEEGLKAESGGDRIRAATAILDRAARGLEALDFAERLAAVEAALGLQAGEGKP